MTQKDLLVHPSWVLHKLRDRGLTRRKLARLLTKPDGSHYSLDAVNSWCTNRRFPTEDVLFQCGQIYQKMTVSKP